ncbi:MAG TPA: BamA/TamA family outer membrane protein, partial [Terriglobales bacterium]|nr:BamA/TamA family outer membrane protein [Terriglobales bacterium]
LVYDNSVFGGTSPFLGRRYRFEANEVVGNLQMHEMLGDLRQYLRLGRSLSLAGRLLHFGRYGPGADDFRLQPLFIGYPWLVRGYDDTSISNALASAPDTAAFRQVLGNFNQLVGSRLAVANLELRIPIFGALGIVPSPSVPPIETALFYDAGTAWDRMSRPDFLGGSRRTVTSYGVAFRANLFGFAVGEADLVHPNDRPGQGWYWELSLQPGF